MTNEIFPLPATNSSQWTARPFHRQFLMRQANRLFDFFQQASINPKGGFHELDDDGHPVNTDNDIRQIHGTARMVHCFAIGSLIGRPGSDEIVDHGMRDLWEKHRDAQHGGYVWGLTTRVSPTTRSRPMAMPSCCWPPPAPSWRAIRWPTR